MLVNVEHPEKTPTLRSNIEIKSRHGNGDERSKAVRSIYFPLTGIVAGSVTIDWDHWPRFGGFSPAALRSNANGVRTQVT